MSRVKTYDKHLVKRGITGKFILKNEDGSPVLGDIHKKGIRLTSDKVFTLNEGWDNVDVPLSFYYVENKEATEKANIAGEEKIKNRKPSIATLSEQNEKLIAAEFENKRLKLEQENAELKAQLAGNKIPVNKTTERIEIEAKAVKLDIKFRADISDEKLMEKINETKKVI